MTIFRTTEPQTREVPIMDVVETAASAEKERPTLRDLVAGFSQHVRSVARCWRVPSRDLDDVAQEAFFRVHRALSRYRAHAAGPKPWLTRIAIRAAQDHLRRNALREELTNDETMEEAMDPKPSAEDCVRFAEAAQIACAIMRGLPEELREVYQLHLDGADERYIAELTELPVTTVHKRLHRARTRVEAAVAELHRNEERRAGAASAMLPILASPTALFTAAEKAPPVPGLEERVLAYLAKTVGLASAGVLASLSALHVAGFGAAILVLGAGTGATIAHAAKPVAVTTIVMHETACTASTTTAIAIATATVAPLDPREKGPTRDDAKAPLSRAAPIHRPWDEHAKIDAARNALTMGDAQGAKALLIEHTRLYPSSQLKGVREEMLQRANAALEEGHERETP